MDSPENARSALDAVDTVAFKVGLKGYNVDEVDEFLERVSTESRQLKDQLQQQRQQLRQAGERINQLESGRTPAPAPAPAPGAPRLVGTTAGAEQVTAMIAMAQQFIEHAQQEAEEKARELTVSAQERAREIVTEARGRAEDEVNRLNGLKQRLSEDVDMLARQLETERTRLTGALHEFAHWVESALQTGGTSRAPSGAPTTPAPVAPTVQLIDSLPPTAPVRQVSPPPAPSAQQQTIGQVLNFEQPSPSDRS